MYQKTEKLLESNKDFMVSDMIGVQLAMILAALLRNDLRWMITEGIFQKAALFAAVSSMLVSLFTDTYSDVLSRGYWKEWKKTLEYVLLVVAGKTALLFLFNLSGDYSRIAMFYFIILCSVSVFSLRLVQKKFRIGCRIRKHFRQKSMFLIGESWNWREMADHILDNPYSEFVLTGIGICNKADQASGPQTGETDIPKVYRNIPVVVKTDRILQAVSYEWVDEVLIGISSQKREAKDIVAKCKTMGITIHQKLVSPLELKDNLSVEEVEGYTVLTSSIRSISAREVFVKRMIDIAVSIVGLSITVLLTLILGPLIFIASPGPIFFSQVRIGKNGRRFKIYKFRSMYMDAESRKKDLMKNNQVESDLMFKMKDDPRIIKGIGKIIREYSLDEFPQFWNVLCNDLSLVGTRPPTEEEFKKYDFHHRMRMSIKPGITGLWQVSGRNDIKDFEKVVALDTEYIRNWNIGLDIKIILKTVGVMLTREGAR